MKFSAHVVDSTFGVPASDVEIMLRRQQNAEWQHVTSGHTDATGCLADWSRREFQHGIYQIEITIDSYYAITGIMPLYSRITAEFHVFSHESHLHLGILIATNSFQIYHETRESATVIGEIAS